MYLFAADQDGLSAGGAHHLREVQGEDGVVGAERLATQKLDAPGGFVAGLFDERDSPGFIADLHNAQHQVEFGEPHGQFLAVLEYPAVDVGVGLGADVAASEQVLQGPAGAVGQFGDVAIEARPPLNGWAGGLVDLGERREVDISVGGHLHSSLCNWPGRPNIRSRSRHVHRGTGSCRQRNSRRELFADVSGKVRAPRALRNTTDSDAAVSYEALGALSRGSSRKVLTE